MVDQQSRLLTVPEVAEHLHLSRSMVYALIQRGQLKVIKIGNATRVAPTALNAFLRSIEDEAEGRSLARG